MKRKVIAIIVSMMLLVPSNVFASDSITGSSTGPSGTVTLAGHLYFSTGSEDQVLGTTSRTGGAGNIIVQVRTTYSSPSGNQIRVRIANSTTNSSVSVNANVPSGTAIEATGVHTFTSSNYGNWSGTTFSNCP